MHDARLGGHSKIWVVAWVDGVEGVHLWSEQKSCATSGLRLYHRGKKIAKLIIFELKLAIS